MSAPIVDLTAAVERIRVRHNTDASRQQVCGFCNEKMVGGYTALQKHLLTVHGILLPLFDNIDDVEGFIADIYSKSIVAPKFISLGSDASSFDSLAEMDKYHLAFHTIQSGGDNEEALRDQVRASPAHWSWEALPAEFAAKYRLFPDEGAMGLDEGAEEDDEEEVGDAGADGNVVVGTKEVGVTSDRIECPYCLAANKAAGLDDVVLFSSKSFAKHLAETHRIDNFAKAVKAVTRLDGSKADFHTNIAVINLLRDATDAGQHPHTLAKLTGSAADILAALSAEVAKSGNVATTYMPSSSTLESVAIVDGSVNEKFLIPRRPNDPLVTYFTQNDEGSDSGSDWSDDDAPTVPTVAELYKMKQEKAAATATSSSSAGAQ